MRIEQAYISESVSSFPWLEKLGLRPYVNPNQPAIFFGMYQPEDLGTLYLHEDIAVVRWCGVDSLKIKRPMLFTDPLIHNISPFLRVVDNLSTHGISCKQIGIENIYSLSDVKPYGDRIYAYMPKPDDYYGQSIINELINRGYDILIGDGSIPREEWDNGKADEIYDQCYVGLVLSHYVGGGGSVVELGLKGRMCITNVLQTPNAIPWRTIDDITAALDFLRGNTVKTVMQISEETNAIFDDAEWLNTEYYVPE
jgi:hypothetical protein